MIYELGRAHSPGLIHSHFMFDCVLVSAIQKKFVLVKSCEAATFFHIWINSLAISDT